MPKTLTLDGRKPATAFRNRVLQQLPARELALIAPLLTPVEMPARHVLQRSGEAVTNVYFFEEGMASLVLPLSDGTAVEAAAVGLEGVVGAEAIVVQHPVSALECIGQVGGRVLQVTASQLIPILGRCPLLSASLARFYQLLFEVIAQSVACGQAHSANARLARWLLTVADLTEAPEFTLTQEFMAEMIGARRPTVSVSAHTLASAGLIAYSRGHVRILDRGALEEASCECYRALRRQYDLLAVPARKPTGR